MIRLARVIRAQKDSGEIVALFVDGAKQKCEVRRLNSKVTTVSEILTQKLSNIYDMLDSPADKICINVDDLQFLAPCDGGMEVWAAGVIISKCLSSNLICRDIHERMWK